MSIIERKSDPGPSIELVPGIITGHYAINGEAAVDPDYADNIGYLAILNMPEGVVRDVAIGRPNCESWPRPLKVHPIGNGRGFYGVRVNGIFQWWAMEIPNFGPCPPGG